MIKMIDCGYELDIDMIQTNLITLADLGVVTFGFQNSEILRPILEQKGFYVENNDLCFEDDLSIGLQMPDTWYLNRGTSALSISMYYNFLGFKNFAEKGTLFTVNKPVYDIYGRVAMIEVYMQTELEKFLLRNKINYFGTPKTMTECMRVLEWAETNRVPRLKSYVPYARFIQYWCSKNFPDYRENEWGLGKEKSRLIFKATGTTNVREGIRYFWQNYLMKRRKKINDGDVEIDVLSRRFYQTRKPNYILIGEDVFTENSPKQIRFKDFSNGKVMFAGHNHERNEKAIRTAELAQEMFPGATVMVFQYPENQPNFTMCKLDEIKLGINKEIGYIAQELLKEIQNGKT